MKNIFEIINGNLLGDGSIGIVKGKYFYFKQTAKDRDFLEWLKRIFQKSKIKCYIFPDNKISGTFALGFYINTTPYKELLPFRSIWYTKENNKTQKTIPKDLELTPSTLFFWYLGDGSLVRRRDDPNRVPFIVLATNIFSEEDIDFLIQKLKEIDLNFYRVRYKSGFTGKDCGFCLYSNTQDGTPFRFFQTIGLECPKEIENCSVGSKGRYKEEKFFKDKWPTEEDWTKILSNIKDFGKILRELRLQMKLTQKELGKKAGMSREGIKNVELGRNCFSVKNFRKVLKALNLDIMYLLEKLTKEDQFKTGG